MKDLSTDACHLDEDPKPLRDALKDFMFSSAPAETYAIGTAARRPPYEIEIYKKENWYVVRAPSLKCQALLDVRLKSLAGGAEGIEAEGRTKIKLAFGALRRAAGNNIYPINRTSPPTDANE